MKGCWQVVCVPEVYSVKTGLERQQTLADELTSPSATPALMVWRCQPALLVTRSETRLPHFDGAAAEMQAAGWPVILRKSGGGACPVGPGTVQVSMIEAAFAAATMNAKYAALSKLIQSTLGFFQIVSETGSVAGAYCPGNHDLGSGQEDRRHVTALVPQSLGDPLRRDGRLHQYRGAAGLARRRGQSIL
jgi:lipoate-protein ligase A